MIFIINTFTVLTNKNYPKFTYKIKGINMNYYSFLMIQQLKQLDKKSILKKLSNKDIDLFNNSETESLKYLNQIFKIKELTIEDIILAKQISSKILDLCKINKIKIIGYDDKNFPTNLKKIPNCPLILYFKGNIESINNNTAIAVVGTRNPSSFGLIMSNHIGKKLAESNIAIISGLAMGCDKYAHEGCLESNGYTIAVMPSGLDKIVPKVNEELAFEILNKNGCLLSEYPPNTRVYPSNYINRNRIQSGLSEGIIIVETNPKGGTIHTAKFAQKDQRNIGIFLNKKDSSFNKGGQEILKTSKYNKISKIFSVHDLLNFIDICNNYEIKKYNQQELIEIT